jgi:hypothetical protein
MMEEKSLIVAEKLDVAVLFTSGGMEETLNKIKEKAMSHVPDISTEQGRKDIASMAHKVARSKTLIDDLGKDRMAEAKKIIDAINPLRKQARDFLDALKSDVRKPLDDYEAEQARIKAEEDRKEKAKTDARIAALQEVGCVLGFFEVAGMTDDAFEDRLRKATAEKEARLARLEAEEAVQKAESDRLEKQRQEQAAEAARLAEEKRKIEAEKKALEDAKREAEHRASIEKARKEAEEQAKKDAEEAAAFAVKKAAEKSERDANEAKEKAKREAAELARNEALKPDKERLISYGKALMDVPRPELSDKAAKEILGYATGTVYQILKTIAKRAEEL